MTLVKEQLSTPISTVPVCAILTSRITELNDGEWLDIDCNPEMLFYMLADAVKYLDYNPEMLFHMLADAVKYLALPKEVQAIDEYSRFAKSKRIRSTI